VTSLTASPDLLRRAVAPKYVGWAACFLAAFGLWIALPPIMARNALWPVLVCGIAAAVGLLVVFQGERKIGWTAVGVAIICGVLGYGATLSSVAHLDGAQLSESGSGVVDWGQMINLMFVFATPIAFAAVGGLFSERSGVVNIGLEGMMLAGCFFGVLGADKLNSWVLGIVCAIVSGAVLGLIHAFLAINMRADQIVGGTAINFLALGITGYFFIQVYGENGTISSEIPNIPDVTLHFLDHIPPHSYGPHGFWYTAIGDLNLMIWILFALLIAVQILIFRTSIGLRLRSVGEHPRAADTVGISVYKTRYAAVVLSGIIASLGGAYLAIGYTHSFTENMTAGRGFIGLAALIFGNWRPGGAFRAALLFGFFLGLSTRIQQYGYESQVLLQALPYVVVLVAVAGVIGRSIPPASVGRPYVKQ
jgi:general nucleoside transport system permease protein